MMKSVFVLALVAFSSFAQAEIGSLSRNFKIEIEGQQVPFVVTYFDQSSAYYRRDNYAETLWKASLVQQEEMYIFKINTDEFEYSFIFESDAVAGDTITGTKSKILTFGSGQEIEGYDVYPHPKRLAEATESEFVLVTELLPARTSDRMDAIKSFSGPLEYVLCDGCEKGDQIWIQGKAINVNVVTENFGGLYTLGCGEPQGGLFQQLVSLGIEFTWVGTINAGTPDYFEGTSGKYYNSGNGELYIGKGDFLSVVAFVDQVVGDIATKLGKDPQQIRSSVLDGAKLVLNSKGVVEVHYQGVQSLISLPR